MNFHRVVAALLLWGGFGAHPQAARAETFDTCAGFITSLPATISNQGVWCLKQDLSTNISSGAAITIATNNVTIDCNDFKVGGLAAGNGSLAYGVYAESRQNATIRHCGIRGFARGITLNGGAGHLVEDNRLDNNLFEGIDLEGTDDSIVRHNRVYDTGGYIGGHGAIGIFGDANVIDNDIDGLFSDSTTNFHIGIRSNSGIGIQIRDNRVSGLALNGGGTAYGIYTTAGDTAVTGNRIIAGESAENGEGIHGAGTSDTFCAGNTIATFSTAMAGCQDAGGNASH